MRKNLSLISGTKVFLICLLVFMSVFVGKASAEWKEPVFPIVDEMQKISDDVFVSTGEYLKVNMGLVISGNEAVIIDAGYNREEALRIKNYVEKNNLTVKYLFLTHRHEDHIANLAMFEDAEILDVNNTIDGQKVIIGNKTFKIIKTIGHYFDEHMSVELAEKNILFAGDVVVTILPSAVAFAGNFNGLIPTLEMLRTKNYSIIVPGHGDIRNPHETINMQLEYLTNVEKHVKKMIKDEATLEEVLEIKLENCIRNTEGFDAEWTQLVHYYNVWTAYEEFIIEK